MTKKYKAIKDITVTEYPSKVGVIIPKDTVVLGGSEMQGDVYVFYVIYNNKRYYTTSDNFTLDLSDKVMKKYKILKPKYGVIKKEIGKKGESEGIYYDPPVLVPKGAIVEGYEEENLITTSSQPLTADVIVSGKYNVLNYKYNGVDYVADKGSYELYDKSAGSTTSESTILTKKNILVGIGIIAGILIVMNWNKVKTIWR